MRYETFKFIMDNKESFLYDDASGTGNDNSTDPGASLVNPSSLLAPIVGKANKVRKALVFILLVLLIIYIFKKI